MNAIPLIRRKLTAARIPTPHVPRPKLVSALHLGLDPSKRLTVVCAGPGYGKSTLVASYLDELEVPACWYALDDSDADVATFLTYMLGAIKARFPGLSDRVIDLVRTAPQLEAVLQTVVGLMAEEMAELAEDGAVLVLDDFHAVHGVEAIAQATELLVQYMPDTWQLLIVTRETPRLSLPQLRVRQQLVELGVRELRFAAPDLRDLLEALSGVALTEAEALELVGATDGWVASVILAAQAVRGGGEDAKALLMRELDQPAALYDYLAQEVFSRQDEDTQAFLLATSLLPEVDAAACREALGLEDAGDRIRQLIQGNILLPEGADGRGPEGYGYHPSFRRFLEARFEEQAPAGAIADHCCRIGRFLAHTRPEEALSYMLRAGDMPAASAQLAAMAGGLVANNQVERLRALIDRFPHAFREGDYALSFYQGEVERLWGNYDQATGLFQRAADLAAEPGLKGRALVHLAAIGMTLGDAKAAATLAEGEAMLAEADLASRSFAANLRGAAALATNRSEEALACYEAALAGYRQLEDAVGQAKVLNNMALCYTRFGRFDDAIATYDEAIAQSEKAGRYPHPMILNNMASIYCYQGRFQEAWQAAERALDLAQLLKMRRDELYAHLCLGSANVGLGDFRRAETHFEACRDGARSIKDKVVGAKAYAALGELSHLQGESARAMTLLEQGVALLGLPIEDPRQGDLAILLGLLQLESGEFEAAEGLLSRLEGEFHALGFRYREAQVAFYRARLAARRGDADAASRFAHAEAIATAHGFDYLLEQERGHVPETAGAPAATPAPAPAKPAVAPAISIQCFGSLQVTVGDRLVPNRDWRGFKTKLILAYLLAHPHGVTKEQLTDLLYAELDTTRTATLVLISRLRHGLEPGLSRETPSRFVHFVDGRYTFNFALPYALDTQEFTYHLKRGGDASLPMAERRTHWKSALALYHGPFLGDLTAADCPWLVIEQERYRRMAQDAHVALLQSTLEAEDYAEALAAAEANLAFDACSEIGHQVKMVALARLGQREAAIRHYGIMRQIFDRELASEPSAETEALHKAISEGKEPRNPSLVSYVS